MISLLAAQATGDPGEPWFAYSIALLILASVFGAVLQNRAVESRLHWWLYLGSVSLLLVGELDALAYSFSQPILWDQPVKNAETQYQALLTAVNAAFSGMVRYLLAILTAAVIRRFGPPLLSAVSSSPSSPRPASKTDSSTTSSASNDEKTRSERKTNPEKHANVASPKESEFDEFGQLENE